MSKAFWDLFGDDYTANCLSWQRGPSPILPPEGLSWKSRWTANPEVVTFRERKLLLFRGNGELETRSGFHDRIGAAEIIEIFPGRLKLKDVDLAEPIIDVGEAGEFDDRDVLDPSAIVFQDRLFVYYSAVGTGPDSVGLAISDDGEKFEKVGKVMTGRAPEVVLKEDRIFMTYQRTDERGAYQLYLASSKDGFTFVPVLENSIFPRVEGGWDSLSLVTGRIWEHGEDYYMVYGGSAYLPDEPDYFGLARSSNLIDWEPHPGNPIFGCGPKGAPDGGAIWFPAIVATENGFVMLYEGSRGKYSWDLSSAICMAWRAK